MAKDVFSVDFTDANEEGFVVLPKGTYAIKTKDWTTYVKESSGNRVFRINAEVTKGEYAKTTLAMFQTYQNTPISKNMFLKMLADFGIVQEGDRAGETKKLQVDFELVEVTDDSGEKVTKVKSIIVNGEKRGVEGCMALAIVSHYTDAESGDTRHTISSIKKWESNKTGESGASGKATTAKNLFG